MNVLYSNPLNIDFEKLMELIENPTQIPEEIIKLSNITQQRLSEMIGKSQSYIANKIRLLSLPKNIQEALVNKKISERHARSLMTVEDTAKQTELLERIIKEKLTVKDLDNIINEKKITEEEIQSAINDIMKSLSFIEDEDKNDNHLTKANALIDDSWICAIFSDGTTYFNGALANREILNNGKNIAFRAKGQERFTRAKTIGYYYTEEQIIKARSIDLLTYLQTYEPIELGHVRGNTYCTREHDSLKISNGKWMWWSRGFGGSSALDYLIKVKGQKFMEAMKILVFSGMKKARSSFTSIIRTASPL